jgi:glycerophosphoryl diester phosphodiesterase
MIVVARRGLRDSSSLGRERERAKERARSLLGEKSLDETFWIVGHRGSPTVEVENTLPSLARALRWDGANALEVDVAPTRDGAVVLWHDFDPHAVTARLRRWELEPHVRYRPRQVSDPRFRRPIADLCLADVHAHYGYVDRDGNHPVSARIPTLEETIEWAITEPRLGLLFLDVKIPKERRDLVGPLLDTLDRAVAVARPRFQIVLETGEPAITDELKRRCARYPIGLDVQPHAGIVIDPKGASALDAALARGHAWAFAQRPRPITILPFATHRRIVARDMRVFARTRLAGFCAFTINDEAEMRTLVALGVTAIQTDRPAVLASVVVRARERAFAGSHQALAFTP